MLRRDARLHLGARLRAAQSEVKHIVTPGSTSAPGFVIVKCVAVMTSGPYTDATLQNEIVVAILTPGSSPMVPGFGIMKNAVVRPQF